jgi:transposase
MLAQQQKIQLSEYSSLYDLIVPKENLLRKINELIDFSFIYDELVNKYCSNNGRTAESPIRMFKYLLLKTIYTVSDVDVVERSRFDMSFKYFLDMLPEEDVINPSSLTKFRKLRLKDTDLLNLLISKTVSIALEKGIIRSKSIIVDATHSLSRSNPFSAIEVLRERSKLLRKTVYSFDEEMKERMPEKNSDNDLEKELAYCKELEKHLEAKHTISSIPAIKEKLNLLKETIEDTQENYTLSKDTDAKTGSKTKSYSISIKSELHQDQIAFQETDYYKEKAKHRYKIEAKNSELKNAHGYGRAISYGINNMQMQGAIAIFTVNLKRIIKLAI